MNTINGNLLDHVSLSSLTFHHVYEDIYLAQRIMADVIRGKAGVGVMGLASSSFGLTPSRDIAQGCFRLRVTIRWNAVRSCTEQVADLGNFATRIFSTYLPSSTHQDASSDSPQQFYNSVHVPDSTESIPAAIQSDLIDCQMFPFQQRAVRWLLRREGVDITNHGALTAYEVQVNTDAPPSFQRTADAEGRSFFFSQLFGVVVTDMVAYRAQEERIQGGILAEEMGMLNRKYLKSATDSFAGLGKTVETIALICL